MPLELSTPAPFDRVVNQATPRMKISRVVIDRDNDYAEINLKQETAPGVYELLPEAYTVLDLAVVASFVINGRAHEVPAGSYYSDARNAPPSGTSVYEVNKNAFYQALIAMYFPGTIT